MILNLLGDRKIEILEARIEELEHQNSILKNRLRENDSDRFDFLTSTLNTMGDPVFVKDDESRLLLVNDAFCEIFHLSREDIIGKTLAENVSPEERESFLAIDRQVIANGIENINEETLTVQGEPTHTISTKKSRFIDSQGNRFLVGIIRDITDRINAEEDLRMSEEQFRSLFTQSQIGSAIIDLNNKILKSNEALCEFLGFSEEEILGQSIEDFCHPNDKHIGQAAIAKLKEGVHNSTVVDKRYIRKDGSIRWGQKSVSLIRDKEGNPLYLLPVILDITDRYFALQSLKDSQLQFKELNDSKDKILSIISHDLRSPLTSIVSYTALLTDPNYPLNDQEQCEFLKLVDTTGRSTLKLLDNLLDWANIQRGKVQINPSEFQLSELVEEIFGLSESAALLKQISLKRKIEVDTLQADRNVLKSILLNLISNAIKFTEKEGLIEVSSTENQEFIQIAVIDNGIGMSPQKCNGLFSITANKSTPGTEKEPGSGLGLILCKDFAKILGGEIWVESTLGQGSTFTISIPKG